MATIEVEATWLSGMSGGPVFNEAGEVIGLVSFSLEPSGAYLVSGMLPTSLVSASTAWRRLRPLEPGLLSRVGSTPAGALAPLRGVPDPCRSSIVPSGR